MTKRQLVIPIRHAAVNPASNGRPGDIQFGKEIPISGFADGFLDSVVVGPSRVEVRHLESIGSRAGESAADRKCPAPSRRCNCNACDPECPETRQSLGQGIYIELIVPDPQTASDENLGGHLSALEHLSLFAWAVRSRDLPSLARDLARGGLAPSPLFETQRDQLSGEALVWDLMGLPGCGDAWPFFIDWRDCKHPSQTNPVAGALVSLKASIPQPKSLPVLHTKKLRIVEGSPALALSLETKRGSVEWMSAKPRGLWT